MKQYIEVMCPVCGRTMGKIIVNKVATGEEGYRIKKEQKEFESMIDEKQQERKLFLDYLNDKWNINKDEWGFIRDCPGGRGSGFPIVGYYTEPEDNPELFRKLKRQLMNGIKWWVNKSWLTKEEILKEIEGLGNEAKDVLEDLKELNQGNKEVEKELQDIEDNLKNSVKRNPKR